MPSIVVLALAALAVPGADDLGTGGPGAGLGLGPDPRPATPIVRPAPPAPPGLPSSGIPAAAALAGGAALIGGAAMRSPRRRSALGNTPVMFVYVPGHGGDPDGFSDLAARLGIAEEQIAVFDYRWVSPAEDPIDASRWAFTTDAADALHAQLAALALSHDRIYVVGHSKGGAVVTEMISRWDDRPEVAVTEVTGVMLLDPAIAAGPLGFAQSLGWFIGDVADDGGFDPVRCDLFECDDVRAHLGESAGVEVVAVRNPDALVTNFRDRPAGLRIYELDDGGSHPSELWSSPTALLERLRDAHGSVLHSSVVASCIEAEVARVGSCSWPAPRGVEARTRGPRNEPEAWPNPDRPQRPLRYWGFGESNGPTTR